MNIKEYEEKYKDYKIRFFKEESIKEDNLAVEIYSVGNKRWTKAVILKKGKKIDAFLSSIDDTIKHKNLKSII